MSDLFGVYIHWPFCKAKCPYCDFNSHVSQAIDHERWAEAYVQEIDYIGEMIKGRKVTSIFFGGGTPSLMKPETVEKILTAIRKNWHLKNDVEITLEANPTSIEAEKFESFKAAGINRVSVGVQSLRDKDLKFLGREHSAEEAIKALKIANDVFDRVSFDLIYARPQQTIKDWEVELTEAVALAKGHLSLYQLTIEQGTPFYAMSARGDFKIPEADQAGEFYEITQQILEAAGLPAYEVSNHAKAGQESLHNLTYWKYGDYAGIGPGAHGRLTIEGQKLATRTHRAPEIYMNKIAGQGHAYHPFEEVNKEESLIEMMMMGLRLREGVEFRQIERLTHQDWRMVLPQDKIQHLVDEGLLKITKTHVQPTQGGLQRLNAVLSYLL
ncbi:MAG TPA: radical SAM family heme chaperone HemW [Alphaproteobacteria bacterium]|nr:radical SAM family heme chaperone HemW [Alphaproteobacteria bacterium]